MAGNYADVPGYFMYLDTDGSIGFQVSSTNVVTTYSTANIQSLIDVNDSTSMSVPAGSNVREGFIFPQLRDLTGYFIRTSLNGGAGTDGSSTIETSPNTTNGLDGTWTSLGNFVNLNNATPTIPSYRTSINSVTSNGIIGVRFNKSGIYGSTYYTIHLYGTYSSGQTPDRLQFWHPTLDQVIGPAYFDWGDVPRSSTAIKPFRLKNTSSSLTAGNITVSLSALTDTSPTMISQLSLSSDGVSYSSTASGGTLLAGAISSTLYVKRDILANASLGLFTQQIKASAGVW